MLSVFAIVIAIANQQSMINNVRSRVSSLESDQSNICTSVSLLSVGNNFFGFRAFFIRITVTQKVRIKSLVYDLLG